MFQFPLGWSSAGVPKLFSLGAKTDNLEKVVGQHCRDPLTLGGDCDYLGPAEIVSDSPEVEIEEIALCFKVKPLST